MKLHLFLGDGKLPSHLSKLDTKEEIVNWNYIPRIGEDLMYSHPQNNVVTIYRVIQVAYPINFHESELIRVVAIRGIE